MQVVGLFPHMKKLFRVDAFPDDGSIVTRMKKFLEDPFNETFNEFCLFIGGCVGKEARWFKG